ncbi:MAG: putative glycosyl hydrolase, family 13 [Acidimicrobiales bacterium]|nr:putative glycosyl hydrolase, family 13 [Acidimicrobiales bacterium]
MQRPWWQSSVVYQIYPRSFADANGDGVGDLAGIRSKLDHLAWLGVDAIWLSPFYRSPMADFGYDVSDYCAVDPLFGTLEDFDRLVAEAHGRDIRVIVDWVPNHTSDQHPWFLEARSSRDSAKRDWYVWRDPSPDGSPPNNWIRAWGGEPAWTFDEATGQWYLHLFLPEQPDLNWREPAVVDAMHDVLRFWLDRGVDGFRMDVLHAIGKDPELPDNPPEADPIPQSGRNDHLSTHALIRGLRSVLEEYDGDRMMVGEVYLLDTAKVAKYYDEGWGVHLSFNFPPLYTRWDAERWRRRIDEVAREIEPVGWPSWVLSNHDNPRHRTRYGSEARARAAAVLLLTLRGTPFLYAGEELGLEDAVVPPERVVDPGGRDGCRAPIPWDGSPTHGWGTTDPRLPWPPEPDRRNAEGLQADEGSILHLYRRLLSARKASPALQVGEQWLLAAPPGVLAWVRDVGEDRRAVVVNFTAESATLDLDLDGSFMVEVASDGKGEGEPFAGELAGDVALVLRPA